MAKQLSGAWWSAPSSNASEPAHSVTRHRLAYLAVLGVTGVVLHATFRWPLHWPGHHGLEWMALLAFAWLTAPGRWSAGTTGAAAALIGVAPLWGFHNVLAPAGYLLSGVVLDLLMRVGPRGVSTSVRLPISAALAFTAAATIPLLNPAHAAPSAFGPGAALLFGAHFGFGLAGGLIGAGLGMLTVRRLAR